jgi:hypothetical protein
MLFLDTPDMEECAESSFLSFLLPQDAQAGVSLSEVTSTSLISPQS